jgi:hypothetical protein
MFAAPSPMNTGMPVGSCGAKPQWSWWPWLMITPKGRVPLPANPIAAGSGTTESQAEDRGLPMSRISVA